ncbi:SRPBCC domain-containing protein [Micromonospora sp. NPDC049523]|uniref:SRPBCC domain-containing protein n=1 Tax=Micromonospora sp. NPDC049523 TaxID=3155921 RepID=UPI003434E072
MGTGADENVPPHPVVRELALPCAAAYAFEVFTAGIGGWWPTGFTASGADLAAVVVEPRAGGRVYERDRTGSEYDWGTVAVWEPGGRIVLHWTLGQRTGDATLVELRFTPDGAGSVVRLEHGGWQPGQAADRARFDDEAGWTVVLESFRQRIVGPEPSSGR